MATYTVSVAREHDIWLIEAVDLTGVRSYGRTLREAAENIREAIAAAEDLDLWLDLNLRFRFEDDAASEVLQALELANQTEEKAAALRDKALRDAIEKLRLDHHLSFRDIATVIGLSHQRVAQLAPNTRV